MEHIPPVKFYVPRINVIREIPQSAEGIPPGVWFYSKNPAVTPEVIETFLSNNYKANLDSRIVRNRVLPSIVTIPADRLTAQERDHLLSMYINLVCVVPAFGMSGLVLWGHEVKGVPGLGMHSLVLAASIAVWVRKLVRTIIGKVTIQQELEVTWQKVKVIVEQQMHDFQWNRFIYAFDVELIDNRPRTKSIVIRMQDAHKTLNLQLDFSMIAGFFLKHEFTYTVFDKVTHVSSVGSIVDDDEVRDTLSDDKPVLDLKFPVSNRKIVRVGGIPVLSTEPPTLSEQALELAEACGAVDYSPPPMRAVRGKSFTFEQLTEFYQLAQAQVQPGEDHGSKGSVAEGDSGLPG